MVSSRIVIRMCTTSSLTLGHTDTKSYLSEGGWMTRLPLEPEEEEEEEDHHSMGHETQ